VITNAAFLGARAQTFLCRSVHLPALQLSELGSAADALETGLGR
jgi:hypothetical protein